MCRTPSPTSMSSSACASTPSATSTAPTVLAKVTSAVTNAWRTGSRWMSRTSDKSILMKSGRSFRMCRRLAYPAPASSTAIRSPAARCRRSAVASAS